MDQRYFVHCYVCAGSCARQGANMGYRTFHDVFVMRPDDCRYAVVTPGAGSAVVWLWDLFDTMVDKGGHTSRFYPPDPQLFGTVDAAVMAAILTYDTKGGD